MFFHVVQLALSILIALRFPLPVRSALCTETTGDISTLRLSRGQDLDAPHLWPGDLRTATRTCAKLQAVYIAITLRSEPGEWTPRN